MRTRAWGLFLVSAVGLLASPALARQDDLFSVVRRAPPQEVNAPEARKVGHFTAYRDNASETKQVDGLGLYATSKGKAVDLTAPDRMMDGPDGSLFSQAAGVGWRNKNMSAMVGYMKPSSIKSATHFENERTPIYRARARFGVGWALHF